MTGAVPPIVVSAHAGMANGLVVGDRTLRWDDLVVQSAPAKAAFLTETNGDAVAAVGRHLGSGGETLIAAARRVDETLREELAGEGFSIHGAGAAVAEAFPRTPEADRIWLLTSGSTGRPKRVAHTLASLTTVSGPQPPRRWLCPYSPGAYAWWQLVTMSLAVPGQDLVFVETAELDDWPTRAAATGVTAVSGTPTFWRQALMRRGDALGALPLQQITLGGEPVDQGILDRLTQLFPAARISWIYASSEAGASIVVHDRRAGFPVSWLDREEPGRPVVRVCDGELVLRSPWRAAGQPEEIRTGDVAEVVGDRVLVTGRRSLDEINVGGAKVAASVVRIALVAHPQVAWARVRGRRAPLMGEVVAADVVLRQPVPEGELRGWLSARLPEHAVPRFLRVLPEIPVRDTLKSDV